VEQLKLILENKKVQLISKDLRNLGNNLDLVIGNMKDGLNSSEFQLNRGRAELDEACGKFEVMMNEEM